MQIDPGATATRPLSRRTLLTLTAGAIASPAFAATHPIKAIAFDAFAILDIRPVLAAAKQASPEHGEALRDLWLQKLFAYTWLRTVAHQYASFTDVIAESLDYAVAATGAQIARADRERLLSTFWTLPAWPDVAGQLAGFKARGLRLVPLSNMSEAMLRANLRHNGLEPFFEAVLSTDSVRAFKPAPEAYALGPRALRLNKAEIVFAPFAAWDAAGASWFGYPVAWVNRLAQPPEIVGAPAVREGRDLSVVSGLIG